MSSVVRQQRLAGPTPAGHLGGCDRECGGRARAGTRELSMRIPSWWVRARGAAGAVGREVGLAQKAR
eukprot:1497708-Prymnesium_polylepis.1